jgi:subtilisin-like proprotein convertase family protein
VAGLALTAAPAAAATVFSNTTAITIPPQGTVSPYPSEITVSGLLGLLTEVEVTIRGFSHTFPDDVGILLVGPGGQAVELLDAAGSGLDAVDLTFIFDDDAGAPLPTSGVLASGTYRPSTYVEDPYPSPAPAAPYGTALSVFDGTDPNGNWRLFVADFNIFDSGAISGGWSLSLTTDALPDPAVVPLPAGAVLLLSGLGLLALRRRG